MNEKTKKSYANEICGYISEIQVDLPKEERINLRKYLISCIIETFSTWSESGDCLPKKVKIGSTGNDYIEFIFHKDEE